MADASEDDLYAATDWLLAGQDRIQKKLAARHLKEDSLVLYDLSSSYFEGSHCPLAKVKGSYQSWVIIGSAGWFNIHSARTTCVTFGLSGKLVAVRGYFLDSPSLGG